MMLLLLLLLLMLLLLFSLLLLLLLVLLFLLLIFMLLLMHQPVINVVFYKIIRFIQTYVFSLLGNRDSKDQLMRTMMVWPKKGSEGKGRLSQVDPTIARHLEKKYLKYALPPILALNCFTWINVSETELYCHQCISSLTSVKRMT